MFWVRYCSSCMLQSFFHILENKLIGYTDDSTFMAVVLSPDLKVTVAGSLFRDLGRVSECVTFGAS